MLWLAIHLPQLPLEALHLGLTPTSPEPWAIVETQGRQQRITACNAPAKERGVHPGQRCSAAQALATTLRIAVRQPASEQSTLEGLANWAMQFSPTVCLDPPDGLLIEIGGCLRYFQGLPRLRRLVAEGLEGLSLSALDAVAPTPLAANWLARLGTTACVQDTAELAAALARLPLDRLPWPAELQQRLWNLGLRRFGELARLPRHGLARRFPGLPSVVDRALGLAPDPRTSFVPPAQFERTVEFNWATEQVEALGFAAKRLLLELAGFLAGRGLGVQQVVWRMRHENKRYSELNVGFGKPTRVADAMLAITRERLGRHALSSPVEALCLRAPDMHRLDGAALDLFGDATQQGDFDLLLARLAARLGDEAVCAVASHADHRPELAWRRVAPGTASSQLPVGERPGWLLAEPIVLEMRDERPWHTEPLVVHGSAERIETGWWDGASATRDYYQAEGPSGRRYWIYQLRDGGGWYLHGLFA